MIGVLGISTISVSYFIWDYSQAKIRNQSEQDSGGNDYQKE